MVGVFLLWFGWFGFNGGSTLAFSEHVPKILVHTAEGGAAGGLVALGTTQMLDKRPQVPLIMNGVIGGLVSVTAGCDVMLSWGAIVTGGIGGLLCTLSVRWLSHYRIDDPVGVIPAHLVCGIWGTLAVVLFGDPRLWGMGYNWGQRLGVQALGVGTIGLYSFFVSFALLKLINRIYPLRVTSTQEHIGLNISEHGANTATQQLIASMNNHSLQGDFAQPVVVEPGTDVAPIANHYNQVLVKMDQIRADLHTSQERLLTILNAPAFPVVISEANSGTIQFINERATELFGFMLQEAGRFRETDFWHACTDRSAFLAAVKQRQRVDSFEASLRRSNGTTFWSLISGLEISYNNQICILFSFSDISNHIERETILRQLAATDALTGVYNRRAFFEQVERRVAISIQRHWPITVLMIDIDHFKQVNDRFGHAKGDQVICSVADTCSSILQEHDLVGRFGGEEFVVLLCNTPLNRAHAIAEHLRQTVEQHWLLDQPDPLHVTISIGIADMQPDEPIDTTLKRADQALYLAKAKGRNCVGQWHQSA